MRRRILWLVPAVSAGALALTAGAVLFTPNFDPDVRTPIEYVPDTDVTVSWTYAVRVGSVIAGENYFLSSTRQRTESSHPRKSFLDRRVGVIRMPCGPSAGACEPGDSPDCGTRALKSAANMST